MKIVFGPFHWYLNDKKITIFRIAINYTIRTGDEADESKYYRNRTT